MPHYAFRGTDRMGNSVDGTVSAENVALAANQIGQMGYALVSLDSDPSPDPIPDGMTTSSTFAMHPPVSPELATPDAHAHGGRIDLTQPFGEMLVADGAPPVDNLGGYFERDFDEVSDDVPLQPWERGGPVEQPPAPKMTLTPTGAVLGRAQPATSAPPFAAGFVGAPPGVTLSGRIVETPRGIEHVGAGRQSTDQANLLRRFVEVIVYPIFSGVVIKDLAPFYRQFATLVGAGLPIYQALVALEGNTNNSRLKEVARAGQRQVQSGGKFSDVLAAWPWVFKPVEVELIRAAEQGGMLEQVLKQIADYVEHDLEIRRLVSRETMYPKIVLFVALMIIGYCGIAEGRMALVKLVLGGMGKEQYSTLQYLSDTLGFGALCIAVFLAPYALFRLSLFNVKGVRESYDMFKNAIPGFGSLAKMFAVARFTRTLAALYRGGFGISQALEIAGDASGNAVLRAAVHRAIPAAERGRLVSESLRSSGFFSSMAIDMYRTGEVSGRLDEMLDKVADFYEAEGKLKTRQSAMIFGTAVFLLVAILVAMQVIGFWGGYGQSVTSGGEQ